MSVPLSVALGVFCGPSHWVTGHVGRWAALTETLGDSGTAYATFQALPLKFVVLEGDPGPGSPPSSPLLFSAPAPCSRPEASCTNKSPPRIPFLNSRLQPRPAPRMHLLASAASSWHIKLCCDKAGFPCRLPSPYTCGCQLVDLPLPGAQSPFRSWFKYSGVIRGPGPKLDTWLRVTFDMLLKSPEPQKS